MNGRPSGRPGTPPPANRTPEAQADHANVPAASRGEATPERANGPSARSEADPEATRASMPAADRGEAPADPEATQLRAAAVRPGGPRRPPRAHPVSPADRMSMTDELEPVGDHTKVRRKIDNTLARFAAAHEELAAEEAKKKERREWLTARPAALIEQTRTRLQRVVAPVKADAEEDPEKAAPQTRLQEKKQRRSDRSVRISRITAAVLAGLIFLATGALWGTKTWFNSKFTEIAALDENSSDIQNAAGQTGDENFLIVGSDTRAGATAEENVGDADLVGGARSDTVMLAHIPADRNRAVVVSFPRDLEISRPPCERYDVNTGTYTSETVSAATKVKLNTAYAVGGPKCLTKWVQQNTGIRVNHFVGIDFGGFKEMVDAVHGVTVHVDSPINDEVLGMVVAETGDVTISGDQALSYVRARHVYGDKTSDYGRIKRQQQFLTALLQKAMSQGVITDPTQLSNFVTAFARATFGDNIGVDQMLTLAQSMKGLDTTKLKFLTVPTVGESNKRGNEELLETKSKELFQAMIDNTPLPGTPEYEAAQAAASSTRTAPTSTSKSSGSGSSDS
ncbi:LCP family protein required for cell wall assembly [Amycolatopsis endophytica]|uniref:LCP family protein required for cell wall assembly n=1 Tax=Amycolatopsis endophytica TaxID=860233 RepID=A0A853B136_9PSEU|nr:LCP family protein required for cell wall assembly [Amycolatopsis endophytica]